MSREIERREEWLSDAMRRAKRRLRIGTMDEFAEQLLMTRGTLMSRLKFPGSIRLEELWRIEAVFRHAGMTEEADMIKGAFTYKERGVA